MVKRKPYVMRISRTTIDKLGIKLYDRVSLAVGELIANSYDADAENVIVKIPLGRLLATKSGRKILDSGLEISVEDDGHGMSPAEINEFFLRVGTNPREDRRRGPRSLEKGRPRIGRKGIGKLAPFGICKIIEVRTAGGRKKSGSYATAHFIMNYDEILHETDRAYRPTLGRDDGALSKKRGTVVKLRNFYPKRIPDRETFHRQLARLYGLQLPDFKIQVDDTESKESFVVGQLEMDIEDETKIDLSDRPVVLEDGTKLPVSGWVAYSRIPYKNEEVAGIRIYARGRLAAVTRDFGLKAGFTGEYTIRSYLIGEIYADWLDLDEGEDLIHTGRQNILWDSEIGLTFQKWGQKLLMELGKKSWSPVKERTWKMFLERSDLENEARRRFGDEEIVQTALRLGRAIGRGLEREDIRDDEYVKGVREVCLASAPHILHVESLKEIEEVPPERPLEAIIKIFMAARIGERASLGQVVMERVDAIKRLEAKLRAGVEAKELELQQLLEGSPWLINPEWTLLSANKTFESMRKAFEIWYEKNYGAPIKTTAIGETKRPDFVMLHVRRNVEIVEIKKPQHALSDEEFDKILGYYDSIKKFLDENETFKSIFPRPHITLVCDALRLDATHTQAYLRLEERGDLIRKTWLDLLGDTKKVHEDFLALSQKS